MANPSRAAAREHLNNLIKNDDLDGIIDYYNHCGLTTNFVSQLKLDSFCDKKLDLCYYPDFKLLDFMVKNSVGAKVVSMYSTKDLFTYFTKFEFNEFVELVNNSYKADSYKADSYNAYVLDAMKQVFIARYFKKASCFNSDFVESVVLWADIDKYLDNIMHIIKDINTVNTMDTLSAWYYINKLTDIVYKYPEKIAIIDPYLENLRDTDVYKILYKMPSYIHKIKPELITVNVWESLISGRDHITMWYRDNDGNTYKLPRDVLCELIQYCDKWILIRKDFKARAPCAPKIIASPIYPKTPATNLHIEEEIYLRSNNDEELNKFLLSEHASRIFQYIENIDDNAIRLKLLKIVEQRIIQGEFK